jgi:hypothetical protein
MRAWRNALALSLLACAALLSGCDHPAGGKQVQSAARPTRATAPSGLPAYVGLNPPRPLHADGAYLHAWSGMQLPAEAGAFRRHGLMQFDQAATDVGGEYQIRSADGVVLLTAYIYPMRPTAEPGSAEGQALCRDEYEDVKHVVNIRFPEAELIDEWRPTLANLSNAGEAYAAAFHVTSDLLGQEMPVRSEVYVFCNVDRLWFVKYRLTYPRDYPQRDLLASMLAATPIPAP